MTNLERILTELKNDLYKHNPEVDVFWTGPGETLEDRVEWLLHPEENTQVELPL
jgi:hypothetical protein